MCVWLSEQYIETHSNYYGLGDRPLEMKRAGGKGFPMHACMHVCMYVSVGRRVINYYLWYRIYRYQREMYNANRFMAFIAFDGRSIITIT